MRFLQILSLFLLITILPKLAHADLRDFISEQAYNLFNKESCPQINPKQFYQVQSICRQGMNTLPSGIDLNDLQKSSELLFFNQSQRQLIDELSCEQSKIQGLQKNIDPLVTDFKLKLPIIKQLKKQAQERINRWQLLQGQIPHNPSLTLNSKYQAIKDEADQLNLEAKQLLQQSESISLSLPFGNYPEIEKLISNTNVEDLKSESGLRSEIKKSLQEANNSMNKDLKNLKSAITREGDVSRSLKERVTQDPDFFKRMRWKLKLSDKTYDGFFCKLNAKYGEGTEIADTTLSIGSGFVGFGIFSYLSKIFKIGNLVNKAKTVALLEKAGTGIGASVISADIFNQIKKECLPVNQNKISVKKDAAKCTALELNRNLTESNCALSIVLPALGFGSAALLSNTKIANDFITKLRNLNPKRSFDDESGFLDEFTTAQNVSNTLNFAVVPDHLVKRQHYQKYMDLRRQGKLSEADDYIEKVEYVLKNVAIKDASTRTAQTGNGGAKFIEFEDGTMGVWKPKYMPKTHNSETGLTNSFSNEEVASQEIAAYKIDNFLGLYRIPPTVERSFRGEQGTVQLMVGNINQKARVNNPVETRMFDYLIANHDRHLNNYLITNEGDLVAIDHGLSMKTNPRNWKDGNFISYFQSVIKKYDDTINENSRPAFKLNKNNANAKINAAKSEAIKTISTLVGDRNVYEKLKRTSDFQWKSLLNQNLNKDQINAFLQRRKDIIEIVEQARQRFGDEIFR